MNDAQSLPLLIERLARVLHNDAHFESLKPTQWEALRYLARANRFSRSPGALTAYLGMTKGTVSQTVQALQRKGLVTKTVEPDDRRAVRLQLTASGHSLLHLDPLRDIEVELAKMSEVSPDDVATGLQGILTALLKARGGRPFGVCKTCRHFNSRHPKGRPNHCDLLQEPLSQRDANDICVEQTAA